MKRTSILWIWPVRQSLAASVLAAAIGVLSILGCSKSDENGRETPENEAPPPAASPQAQKPRKPALPLEPLVIDDTAPTVGETYPQMSNAALFHARLMPLPEGVLFRTADVVFTQDDIDDDIAQAPREVRDQLRNNGLFVLEQVATHTLLVNEAREVLSRDGRDVSSMHEGELFDAFFEKLVAGVSVSDAEVAAFYEAHKAMVAGRPLDEVAGPITDHLLHRKRQEAIEQHIRKAALRHPAAVSANWATEAAAQALDNPIDRARTSGKPTLVDFGSEGCMHCATIAPMRDALRGKYEGRVNVVYIDVAQEQVLSRRYEVRGIPLLVFYDAAGNEVHRDDGSMTQEDIEAKFEAMAAGD